VAKNKKPNAERGHPKLENTIQFVKGEELRTLEKD
jgi:hypothetical protein